MAQNLSENYIAKIEGHGSLEIDWGQGNTKLHIHEGERLFEGMLVGRKIEEAHWITPRICGVCPIAHNLASVKASEDGYGITESGTTHLLRELMICGQNIQSHVLHLFFLSLPDYLGIDRATELAKKNPTALKNALALKELGDEIAFTVAGRNVHPTTTTIGGFQKIPTKDELEKLLKLVKKTRDEAQFAAKLTLGIKYPELHGDFELVAIENGQILSSKNPPVTIKEYKQTIEEEIKDYSTAKFGTYKKHEMMVGSIARLYFSLKNTATSIGAGEKLFTEIDFQNPFHNNIAQGIETLLYHEKAEKIIEELLNSQMDPALNQPSKQSPFQGIGAVEAPRGTLYHELHFDENKNITYANIITPTVQNLLSMENNANALLKQHAGKTKKEIEHLMEMLIRAYDPCITCSVH
jgi:coenzyme F420-reducing hydrogenase alpha subunit